MKKIANRKGFTLIELLVVIGIIAILAAIVVIAVNPGKQYGQARDAQRWSDINALLNGIHQYAADNNGSFPAAIPATATVMGNTSGQYDVCSYLVPKYLASMPYDPSASGSSYTSCAAYNTGYTISLVGGRVTIAAPSKEQTTGNITLTR